LRTKSESPGGADGSGERERLNVERQSPIPVIDERDVAATADDDVVEDVERVSWVAHED
jgi:hypothetical protein